MGDIQEKYVLICLPDLFCGHMEVVFSLLQAFPIRQWEADDMPNPDLPSPLLPLEHTFRLPFLGLQCLDCRVNDWTLCVLSFPLFPGDKQVFSYGERTLQTFPAFGAVCRDYDYAGAPIGPDVQTATQWSLRRDGSSAALGAECSSTSVPG